METLILLRHGETTSNIKEIYQGQGDGVLSATGKEQAFAAAAFFSKIKIDSIFCSDLSRAYDTAKIVARHHRSKIIKMKALRERFYGEWEGLRFDEIDKKYKSLYRKWLKNPDRAKIPCAETLEELQKRGLSAIKKIQRSSKGKTVLIVAHGGTNRAILFHYLGLDLNNFWKIRQNNCCYNVIEFKKPYPKVVTVNNTCYLGTNLLAKKNVLS